MSIGKKRRTITPELHTLGGSKDPIRLYSGKLWRTDKENIVFGSPDNEKFSIEYVTEPITSEAGLFPVTEQIIKLVPKLPAQNWEELLRALENGENNWQDCPFEYSVPYKHKEASEIAIDNTSTLVADVDPEYNFYVKEYEDKLDNAIEKMMPCIYSFVSEKESAYTVDTNSWYNRHMSLENTIEGPQRDVITVVGKETGENDNRVDNYFKTWAHHWNKLRNHPESYAILSRKFRNIIFSQTDIDFLTSFSDKKEIFPMHMSIKFSTGTNTQMSTALKEADLSADLITYIGNTRRSRPKYIESSEFLSRETGKLGLKLDHNISYSTWDITEWWRSISEERNIDNTIIFGRNKSNESKIVNECRPQIANLLKVLWLGKVRKLVKQNSRTLKEVFEEGKLANSETVFYQVNKYSSRRSKSPMQSFYIPNSDKLGICNLIDTQVKYNTGYRYKIYAYQLVFGIRYNYEKVTSARGKYDAGAQTMIEHPHFKVTTKPYLKLVKVPYFDSGFMKILDSPPVAPDVDVIPYRGISDQILFNFNANVGDYILVPEIIEDREEEMIRDLELARKDPPGSLINYASDDPPKSFQIYRLNYKPETYRDFSGNMIKEVPAKKDTINLAAVSYIDNIVPNIKYYYTFRSVDVHNHLSYPSPVFEIEMVEEDGTVYLLMNIIELKKFNPRVSSTTMNKHILITPSFAQGIVNEKKTLDNINNRLVAGSATSALVAGSATSALAAGSATSAKQLMRNDVVLGVTTSDSVWGKNFKFRFTSKNTGRKFDLNVKFKHIFNYDKGKSNT